MLDCRQPPVLASMSVADGKVFVVDQPGGAKRRRPSRGARNAFVDESFADDYLVAAVVILAGEVATTRQSVRGLLDRRQRRIHFKDESVQRRNRILDVFDELDLEARVYVSAKSPAAREKCLTAMVPDLTAIGVTRLVLERSDTLVALDKRTLYRLVRQANVDLEYDHLRAHEELLLCVADAIAWCSARGGSWRERVAHYTTTVEI